MSSGLSTSEDDSEGEKSNFSDFIYGNRINIFIILMGFIFLGSGLFIYKNSQKIDNIEIIETVEEESEKNQIVVEIAGAVEKPGVYVLMQNSRVEELLIKSGGLSADADRVWVEKYINRAAILSDGQKYFIPRTGEHSQKESANITSGDSVDIWGDSDSQNKPVNINTASQKELESLPGIGPVYAQDIIDHRPYSSVEDLLSKGALKNFVYEKIKDKVSVY